MAAPRFSRIITALDVGSSKVSALIAGVAADGTVHALAASQQESRGVRRSYVADIEQAELAIRDAIEHAERQAGRNIDEVWVAFSAGSLTCRNLPFECNIGGARIDQADIDELLASARSAIDSEGRMVLHAQPALYTIDGLNGVRNPIGLYADRLAVDVNVLLADSGPVRNLDLAVRSAHLHVNGIVAAPLATGLACLTDEEREMGVALVDIGASVTTVALFAGGLLVDLALLPTGVGDITDDIATAFGVPRASAQRAQSLHGSALSTPRDTVDEIVLSPPGSDGSAGRKVNRAQLISIIRQRLDQIMTDIGRTLKDMGCHGPMGCQVVLVGGGAELRGIAEHAHMALGRTVKVGQPQHLVGLPTAHSGPGFATLAGLALYAASDPVDLRDMVLGEQTVFRPEGQSVWRKLVLALRGGLAD